MNVTAITATPQPHCDEVEALLPLIADGALSAGDDPALFAHLGRCQHCQDSLARHDLVTIALERTAGATPLRTQTLHLRWPAALAAAAAMLLLASGGWWLVTTPTPRAMVPVLANAAANAEKSAFSNNATSPLPANSQQPYVVILPDGSTLVVDPRAREGADPTLRAVSNPTY